MRVVLYAMAVCAASACASADHARASGSQYWIPYVHDWGCRLHLGGVLSSDSDEENLLALTGTIGITFIRQARPGALADWDLEPSFATVETALLIRFSRYMLGDRPPPLRVVLADIELRKDLGHKPTDLDLIHFAATGADVDTIWSRLGANKPVYLKLITEEKTHTVQITAAHFRVAAAMMRTCIDEHVT